MGIVKNTSCKVIPFTGILYRAYARFLLAAGGLFFGLRLNSPFGLKHVAPPES